MLGEPVLVISSKPRSSGCCQYLGAWLVVNCWGTPCIFITLKTVISFVYMPKLEKMFSAWHHLLVAAAVRTNRFNVLFLALWGVWSLTEAGETDLVPYCSKISRVEARRKEKNDIVILLLFCIVIIYHIYRFGICNRFCVYLYLDINEYENIRGWEQACLETEVIKYLNTGLITQKRHFCHLHIGMGSLWRISRTLMTVHQWYLYMIQ